MTIVSRMTDASQSSARTATGRRRERATTAAQLSNSELEYSVQHSQPPIQPSHAHAVTTNMTKNQPSLHTTVSTADLYSDPTPPPRHASLARTHTTVHRPRPNPFIRSSASRASLVQQPSARHSFAGPVDN